MDADMWFGIWCIGLGVFGLIGYRRRWPALGTDRVTRWLQRMGVVRDEAYYQRWRLLVSIGAIVLGIVFAALSIATGN